MKAISRLPLIWAAGVCQKGVLFKIKTNGGRARRQINQSLVISFILSGEILIKIANKVQKIILMEIKIEVSALRSRSLTHPRVMRARGRVQSVHGALFANLTISSSIKKNSPVF
jgi:hypothetical protein